MNIFIHNTYKATLEIFLFALIFCNSTAMNRVPHEYIQKHGYGKYTKKLGGKKYLIVENNFANQAKESLRPLKIDTALVISEKAFNLSATLRDLLGDMQTSMEKVDIPIPLLYKASTSTIQTGLNLLSLYEPNNIENLHSNLKDQSQECLIDLANLFSYLDVPKEINKLITSMLSNMTSHMNPNQAVTSLTNLNPDLKKEMFIDHIIPYLRNRAIEKNGQNIHSEYLKNNNDQTDFFNVLIAKFSPNGQYIATEGMNANGFCVTLWDAKNKNTPQTLIYHNHSVTSPSFSPDSKYIAAIAREDNPIIVLWNIETKSIKHELYHTNDAVSALFSPDGTKVIAAYKGKSQNLILWDVESGTILKRLEGHENDATSAMFSPNGKYIVSTSQGSKDNLVIWSAQTGEKIISLGGHKKGVEEALFSPNGQYLISIPKPMGTARRIPGTEFISSSLDMSDNGGLIIWNMKEFKIIENLSAEYLTNTYISPDSTKALIKVSDGTGNLFLFDFVNLTWIALERGANNKGIDINATPFSPDSKLMVSQDLIKNSANTYPYDSHLTLRSAITGKMIQSYPAIGNIFHSTFSPDGTEIISIPRDSQSTANLIVSSIIHRDQKLFFYNLQANTDDKIELLYKLSLAQEQNIALNLTKSEWEIVENLPPTIRGLLDFNAIQLTQETKQLYVAPTPYVIPPQAPLSRLERLREYLASWLSYFKR